MKGTMYPPPEVEWGLVASATYCLAREFSGLPRSYFAPCGAAGMKQPGAATRPAWHDSASSSFIVELGTHVKSFLSCAAGGRAAGTRM
jgi:hypothetical protein